MSRADHFLGAVLIITSASAFVNLACDALIKHPNWWGAFLALSTLGSGLMVCRSIWRDRL